MWLSVFKYRVYGGTADARKTRFSPNYSKPAQFWTAGEAQFWTAGEAEADHKSYSEWAVKAFKHIYISTTNCVVHKVVWRTGFRRSQLGLPTWPRRAAFLQRVFSNNASMERYWLDASSRVDCGLTPLWLGAGPRGIQPQARLRRAKRPSHETSPQLQRR